MSSTRFERSWTFCESWSTDCFEAVSLCWPAELSSLLTRVARSFCCVRRSETELFEALSLTWDSSVLTRSSSCETRWALAPLPVGCELLLSFLSESSAQAASARATTESTPSRITAVLSELIWSRSSTSHAPSSSTGAAYSRSRTRGGGPWAGGGPCVGGRRRVGSSGGVDISGGV